jgi:putative N6-adenine-specific DNA methylase
MCGSGTIPIEAALKASRRPPGLLRTGFGFQRWLGYDSMIWRKLVQDTHEQSLQSIPVSIIGSDVSIGAIQNAWKNAERAGMSGAVSFIKGDIGSILPSNPPGILLINPPYGVRLGEEKALEALYKKIGDVMKRNFSGYTAFLLTGNPTLAKCVGLKASRRIVLYNGPIECRLLRYELY